MKRACPQAEETLAVRSTPARSADVPLAEGTVHALRTWLRAALANPCAPGARSVAYVSASSGAGLSTLVRLLAREEGAEAVWGCAADSSDRAMMHQAGASLVTVTLAPKVLVLDELDGIQPVCTVEVAALARSKQLRAPLILLDHTGSRQRRSRLATSLLCGPKAVAAPFEFAAAGQEMIMEVVRKVARREGLTAGPATRVAAAAGDLRAAINGLEAGGAQGMSLRFARDAIQSLNHLLGPVPAGEPGSNRGVVHAIRAYDDDPSLAAVMHEGYLVATAPPTLETMATLADGFSQGDVIDNNMYLRQDFGQTMTQLHACLTCAAPTLLLPPRNGGVCDKFGTTWSRIFNQRAREGVLRGVTLARRERGLIELGVLDLALLCKAMQLAIQNGDGSALQQLAEGLEPTHVQAVCRFSFSKKVPTIAAITKLLSSRPRQSGP